MYSNFNTTFSRPTDTSPLHCPTTPLQHNNNQLITFNESDSVLDSLSQLNSETSYNNAAAFAGSYNSCSSGCTSYMGSPSSLASYETQRVSNGLIQRSISSHSLQKNDGAHYHPFIAELLDQENGPVRRVYSAGDLQRVNGMQQHYHQSDSPLSIESSMIIEEINREASPYSPQEKKMRIERYRSKRNQRNYTKKIKYVCRKKLADSRPRIRGRFARNDDEIVMNPPNQWSNIISNGDELEDEEDENWANFFDSLAPTSNLAQEPQHSSSFGVFY